MAYIWPEALQHVIEPRALFCGAEVHPDGDLVPKKLLQMEKMLRLPLDVHIVLEVLRTIAAVSVKGIECDQEDDHDPRDVAHPEPVAKEGSGKSD